MAVIRCVQKCRFKCHPYFITWYLSGRRKNSVYSLNIYKIFISQCNWFILNGFLFAHFVIDKKKEPNTWIASQIEVIWRIQGFFFFFFFSFRITSLYVKRFYFELNRNGCAFFCSLFIRSRSPYIHQQSRTSLF